MNDPRLGLPSASSFSRLAACPGSFNFAKNFPELQSDAAADRGTRIHKAWETGDDLFLSADEHEDYTRALGEVERIKSHWLEGNDDSDVEELKEVRLWLKDANDHDIASGQFDRLFLSGNRALVMDLKSGWCKNLAPSEASWQLRLLAVMVWRTYQVREIQSVRVAFIRPKLKGSDITDYSVEHLHQAEFAIQNALWHAASPDAHLSAGPHCTYCKAKPHCRSAAAYSLLPSVVSSAVAPTPKADVQAMVAGLTPADWAYIKKRAATIRNILESVDAQLEALDPETLAQLGFRINDGRKIDPITHVQDAFNALSKHLPEAELWQALEMGKGSLVKAAMRGKGLNESQAKKWVAEHIQPFVTPKRSKGSLEEI